MRISIVMGYFLPVPPLAGGATEKIWSGLAQHFTAGGHHVTLVSRRWPGLPDRETHGCLTHLRLAGMNHTRSLPRNLLLDAIWSWRVARSLPAADVVVCNTVSLPIYLRRIKPAAGRVAVVLGRMPKGQCRLYGAVDCVLATSAAVAVRAARENPALAPRTQIFPNPIDWQSLASLLRPAPVTGTPVVIGYVGRIHPEKGLDLLMAAADLLALRSDLPEWRLELVGPDRVIEGGAGPDYVARLKSSLTLAAASRVTFAGPEFDAACLAARYAAFDVFCYPSVAERGETFGIAIAESMAAGCAPVVSALSCFRDLVTPDLTGLVFEHTGPDAPATLADRLAQLLRDAPQRRALGQRAREHARRYDFAESAEVVLAALRRCVGS